MKLIGTVASALLVGIALGWFFWGRAHDERSAAYHWEKVEEYREFIENPDSYEKQGGFSVAFDVPVVAPHLAALVAMDELNRQEFIIPELPNERQYILAWMEFCRRPGIFEATGPGRYQKGEIPLMFTVWYSDDAEAALTVFVDDLRAKAAQRKIEGEPQR